MFLRQGRRHPFFHTSGLLPRPGIFYCLNSKGVGKGFIHKGSGWLRTTAILLAGIITFESALWADGSIASGVTTFLPAERLAERTGSSRDFYSMSIPKDLGHIESAYQGNSEGLVIHIQDAHLEEDAQIKISETIQYLSSRYGSVSLVMEGLAGESASRILAAYPGREARKKVADVLLSKSWLSGPEHAAILQGPEQRLFGAEDEGLYEANRRAFLKVSSGQAAALREIKKVRSSLSRLNRWISSSALIQFQREREKIQGHATGYMDYAVWLSKVLRTLKIRFEKFPNLKRLTNLAVTERRLNKARKSDAEKGKILIRLQEQIKPEIFSEIRHAEKAILERLIKTPAEWLHAEWIEKAGTLEKLLALEMTGEDIESFSMADGALILSGLHTYLEQMSGKHGFENQDIRWRPIEEGVEGAELFYRLALQRDKALAENAVQYLQESRGRILVFVAGGFHTAGIQKKLREKSLSYITLRPVISKLENPSKMKTRYAAAMSGGASELEKAILAVSPSAFDPGYQLQTPRYLPALEALSQDASDQRLRFISAAAMLMAGSDIYQGSSLSQMRPSKDSEAYPFYHALYQGAQVFRRGNHSGLILFSASDASEESGVVFWGMGARQLGIHGYAKKAFPLEGDKSGGLFLGSLTALEREALLRRVSARHESQQRVNVVNRRSLVTASGAPIPRPTEKRSELRKEVAETQMPAAVPSGEKVKARSGRPFSGVSEFKSVFSTLMEISILGLALAFGTSSVAQFAGVYFLIRLLWIAAAFFNETGHYAVARRLDHSSEEIRGVNFGIFNLSAGEWLLKLLPLGWFFRHPYLRVPASTVYPFQDKIISQAGWIAGFAGSAAMTGLAFAGFKFLGGFKISAWMVLLSFGVIQLIAFLSDYFVRREPGVFPCGVIACFEPDETGEIETLRFLVDTIRPLDPRGWQAEGTDINAQVRSRAGLAFLISIVLSFGIGAVNFASSVYLGASLSGVPFYSLFAAAVIVSVGFAQFIGAGAVAIRVRIVKPKRADLAVMSVIELIKKIVRTSMIFSKQKWLAMIAHVRFATSSPHPKGTQPHSWVNPTWWRLLFHRTKVWELSGNEFKAQYHWGEITVGHNGDLIRYYFKKFKKWVEHKRGPDGLHTLLGKLLHWKNKDKGDTVNISGLMKLLTTRGNFIASLRLALLQVEMETLEDNQVPSKRHVLALAGKMDQYFARKKDHYLGIIASLPGMPKELSMDTLTEEAIRKIEDDFVAAFVGTVGAAEFGVKPANFETVVRTTIRNFFKQSLFNAIRLFAVNQAGDANLEFGEAEGTFGLAVKTPMYREMVFYRQGQPFSVAFDPDFRRAFGSSERAILNQRRYRYRIDLNNGEIMRITWDENRAMRFSVYDTTTRTVLSEDEVKKRLRDMKEDPYISELPDTDLRDPVGKNIHKIPGAVDHVHQTMLSEEHENYEVAKRIVAEHILHLARYEKEHGRLPGGTHILFFGKEASRELGEIAQEIFKQFFPHQDLEIKTVISDDLIKGAVDFVDHPEEFRKQFGLDPEHTLIVGVSQSGRTFEGVEVLPWLGTLVKRLVVISGDRDNLMTDYLGQGAVLSTDVGGLQLAEPRTHVNLAIHALINEVVLLAADEVQKEFGTLKVLGGRLSARGLDYLKRDWALRRDRLESITGRNKLGEEVLSKLRKGPQTIGKKIGHFSLEAPISNFLTVLLFALAVQFAWPIFPTPYLREVLHLDLVAWFGFLGGGVEFAMNFVFLYFFGRFVTTRLWRMTLKMLSWGFSKLGMTVPFEARALLHRSGGFKVLIGESRFTHDLIRSMGSKMFALGYKYVPDVKSSPLNQFNDLISQYAARGDVAVFARQRHGVEQQGSMMSSRHTRGNRSFGESVVSIAIGHEIPDDPDAQDYVIDLEDGRGIAYEKGGFDAAELVYLKRLRERMFDSLERSAAEYIVLHDMGETVSKPWYTRIFVETALHLPVVNLAAKYIIYRYPHLVGYYPNWRTHDGTNVDTTASPTLPTEVQAKLAKMESEAREQSGPAPRMAPAAALPERFQKRIPLPEIPVDVYRNGTHSFPAGGEPVISRKSVPMLIPVAAHPSADTTERVVSPHATPSPSRRRTFGDISREMQNPGNRSELRHDFQEAISSKTYLQRSLILDVRMAELKAKFAVLRELKVNPLDGASYWNEEHLETLKVHAPAQISSAGAYVLADYHEENFIERILKELSPSTPLLLYLDARKTTKQERLSLINRFGPEIAAGKIKILRSTVDFEGLILKESKDRGIAPSDIMELTAGDRAFWAEETNAVETALISAAKLTEGRIIVIGERRRLSGLYGELHWELSEAMEGLIEATRRIASAA